MVRRFPKTIRRRHLPPLRFPGESLNGSSASASAIPLGYLRVPVRKCEEFCGRGFWPHRALFLAEKVSQGGPGGGFPRISRGAGPGAACELKILAEVCGGLVLNRIGPAFAALIRGGPVVVLAVEADPEIRPAGGAGVVSTGRPGGGPIATAGVAVGGHGIRGGRRTVVKNQKGINLAVDPLVMGPQYALTQALRSATEPTEVVSTAPSRARPLCQPLVDTENHPTVVPCRFHRFLMEKFPWNPVFRSKTSRLSNHPTQVTDEKTTASRRRNSRPRGVSPPLAIELCKAFSLSEPDTSTQTSRAAARVG